MVDLPKRAARAGAHVTILDKVVLSAAYDLVLLDVPCSGSGSWRRDPQGKWRLTPDDLARTLVVQSAILDKTPSLIKPGGCLAYVTCSYLRAENEAQIEGFQARWPGWELVKVRRYSPMTASDGFFLTLLTRKP